MELYNLYTYGFLGTPVASLELPVGISSSVRLISSAGVSALVEPGISLELLQNNDEELIKAVLCHDRVISEIFRKTTVLPLRFGTSFESKKSLLTHLESHAEEYLEKLNQLNQKSEYILKFIARTPDQSIIPTEARGKQYFLAKKQRYQVQQDFYTVQTGEWENAVDQITEIYKSAIVVKPENEAARIYVLVSRENEHLLAEQFLTWQKACPSWELQLGEAVAPYHFISS